MRALVMLLVLAAAAPAAAQPVPPALAAAGVDEHLGAQLPRSLSFRDAAGQAVTLGSQLTGDKPVLLVLVYYECPMLCSLVLDGAVRAIRELEPEGWRVGRQYRVLTISFSAEELPYQAGKKQGAILGELPGVRATDWPFWVGDAASIAALTSALGFRFVRDPATGQLAHPAVVFVLTPDGVVSRYLYGLDFPARDLKLALLEAGGGKVGTVGERLLLTCFRYDPATRRYGFFIQRFMQAGALLVFAMVATLLVVLWRYERRRA